MGQVILVVPRSRATCSGSDLRTNAADSRKCVGDPFEPFVLRRSTDHSGLGLGLSIARQAVRAHAGDITIHNRPAVGCMFLVSLPLAVTTPVAEAIS